jgi:hypothetical protein
MFRHGFGILAIGMVIGAGVVQAAPQQMSMDYDLYRNGQKLGSVTDTFSRSGNQYRLVSVARATGPMKGLWPGNLRLESRGEVTAQGLRPASFRHDRSDQPQKFDSAQLDWKQHTIIQQYKGRTRQVAGLKDGAQDQLSQLYQFVFMPRLPGDYVLQVVSGRKLDDYHYRGREGGQIKVPAGDFATREFVRIRNAADEKAITVWIAPARNNVPVQVRVTDDGVIMEQRLVRFSARG